MNRKPLNHKTKIVCTIGPASRSEDVLEKLMRRGMRVARLNFSHGTVEGHREDICRIRAVAAKLDCSCAILADLPGSKIRIGKLRNEPVTLKEGDQVILTTKQIAGTPSHITVNCAGLTKSLSKGSLICLNDGLIQLQVEMLMPEEASCKIIVGGHLRSHKGVILPGATVFDPVAQRDLDFIDFGLAEHVDAFCLSVEKADHVLKIKEYVKERGGSAYIVGKIERAEAIKNVSEILEAADAIMIAPGDLGAHVPIEDRPVVQKKMIHKANLLGRPVIIAGQMLPSMINHARPAGMEVSDVANAILDGTDAILLSDETAIGRYPVEALDMVARIAVSVEQGRRDIEELSDLRGYYGSLTGRYGTNVADIISFNAAESARALPSPCIVAPTEKGDGPRRISRFKPDCWILAFSTDATVIRFMNLSYGVLPVWVGDDGDDSFENMMNFIAESELAAGKNLIMATDDARADHGSSIHSLRIVRLSPDQKDGDDGQNDHEQAASPKELEGAVSTYEIAPE